jgi:hypothetical protein
VQAQTEPGFRWLLFCDSSTDSEALGALERCLTGCSAAELVLVRPGESALPAILAGVDPGAQVLATTRLDSDDMLSAGYVARVADYVPAFVAADHEAMLVNFPRGLKYDVLSGTLYESYQPHSPYLTLLERVRPGRHLRTVASGNHGFMHLRYPLHQDLSDFGWCQLVHGGNVSNHVHGADWPAPRSVLNGRFDALRSGPSGPEPVAAPQPEGAEARAVFRQGLEDAITGPE